VSCDKDYSQDSRLELLVKCLCKDRQIHRLQSSLDLALEKLDAGAPGLETCQTTPYDGETLESLAAKVERLRLENVNLQTHVRPAEQHMVGPTLLPTPGELAFYVIPEENDGPAISMVLVIESDCQLKEHLVTYQTGEAFKVPWRDIFISGVGAIGALREMVERSSSYDTAKEAYLAGAWRRSE
jgi:hypothetical protein